MLLPAARAAAGAFTGATLKQQLFHRQRLALANSSDALAVCCMAYCLRRRWGYFPMLAKLRAVSAKPRKPPVQQQQLNVSAAGAAVPADDAAAAAAQDDWDGLPDSPKSNWMEVMKQKKRAKEDGIAQMIRIKHAVLIIQVRGVGAGGERHLQVCARCDSAGADRSSSHVVPQLLPFESHVVHTLGCD
jgi:hypothetical protein